MKIKTMTLHVNDQEKALRFYTEKLGFVKKADFTNGNFRWLTVVAAEEPGGVELVLQQSAFVPAAQTYQQALHQQGMPAVMFFVDDLAKEHDRLRGLDVAFTKPPMKTTGSTIAMLDDGCGNLVQLTQLDAWAK
ncbi:MAG TPA: VOC family protein [Polyangiaceae bacterium]|jgi:predicted enzyme related to lactoylglutathione lyase|nr:VOC family protein [Polyangiaceae bacterium]